MQKYVQLLRRRIRMQWQIALAAVQRAVVLLPHRNLRRRLLRASARGRRVGGRRDAHKRIFRGRRGGIEDRECLFLCEGRGLWSRWRRAYRCLGLGLSPSRTASLAPILGRQLLLGHTLGVQPALCLENDIAPARPVFVLVLCRVSIKMGRGSRWMLTFMLRRRVITVTASAESGTGEPIPISCPVSRGRGWDKGRTVSAVSVPTSCGGTTGGARSCDGVVSMPPFPRFCPYRRSGQIRTSVYCQRPVPRSLSLNRRGHWQSGSRDIGDGPGFDELARSRLYRGWNV